VQRSAVRCCLVAMCLASCCKCACSLVSALYVACLGPRSEPGTWQKPQKSSKLREAGRPERHCSSTARLLKRKVAVGYVGGAFDQRGEPLLKRFIESLTPQLGSLFLPSKKSRCMRRRPPLHLMFAT
jgi:hypothetical protein